MHPMLLGPSHQLFPAETGVGPQNDLYFRPATPDLFNDTLHLLLTAARGILISGAQTRTQQVLAAEDVQRQITIAVVIAVKETPLLMAMQRQIRHIQIQYDLLGSRLMRFQK